MLGGDVQGCPNGRRLGDDVIDIEEQAVGGFLVGHKLPLGDGVDDGDTQRDGDVPVRRRPAERRRRHTRGAEVVTGMRLLVAAATAAVTAVALLLGGLAARDDARGSGSVPARTAGAQLAAGFAAGDTESLVLRLQAGLRAQPGSVRGLDLLGLAYQQRARETGDPAYYAKSQGVAAARAVTRPARPGGDERARLARALAARVRPRAEARPARP